MRSLSRDVKRASGIVDETIGSLKNYGVMPVEELDHIHVCTSKETGEVILLSHLYDNFQGSDYRIHHPNKDKRNVLTWYENGELHIKVLDVFDFDLHEGKNRITVYGDELGLKEFVYVDIVYSGRRIKSDRKQVRVKKYGYDLIYSKS